MKLKIKFLDEFKADAQMLLPTKATPGSAGFDLKAAEDATIYVGQQRKVRSGFCMEIEEGYEVQVRPRSGLAIKHRVTIINSPGTIDSDYRGEMCAALVNHGATPFEVKKGDRIAQMVVCKLPPVTVEIVEALSDTQRGSGGFGSTGVSEVPQPKRSG